MNDEPMHVPADATQPDHRRQQPIAECLDFTIRSAAPQLTRRLWYGLPAYALENTVLCFFRSPQTFGERSLAFGFTDEAQLDEGTRWSVSFPVTGLGPTEEARVPESVPRAGRATASHRERQLVCARSARSFVRRRDRSGARGETGVRSLASLARTGAVA